MCLKFFQFEVGRAYELCAYKEKNVLLKPQNDSEHPTGTPANTGTVMPGKTFPILLRNALASSLKISDRIAEQQSTHLFINSTFSGSVGLRKWRADNLARTTVSTRILANFAIQGTEKWQNGHFESCSNIIFIYIFWKLMKNYIWKLSWFLLAKIFFSEKKFFKIFFLKKIFFLNSF